MKGLEGMKERPILFSAPKVRAILAGTKSQERLIIKPKHMAWIDASVTNFLHGKWDERPLPYGQPGDRLWVRETWTPMDDARYYTKADKVLHHASNPAE